MPRKHISVTTATAYSYEQWAGRSESIVHAITDTKEKVSLILPRREVDRIAKSIDAGETPMIVVSATLFTAEAARSALERS